MEEKATIGVVVFFLYSIDNNSHSYTKKAHKSELVNLPVPIMWSF
jgi:hypothetical protein